jgi:hypothetical protein
MASDAALYIETSVALQATLKQSTKPKIGAGRDGSLIKFLG